MTRRAAGQSLAIGGLVFSGTMMILIAVWQVLMGVAAIAQDEFFVVAPNYIYEMDTSAWGWVHLVLGALLLLVGLAVFSGAAWARAIGIVLAALTAIDHFFFIPYYPLWSLATIALAVFVIWSLAAARPWGAGSLE